MTWKIRIIDNERGIVDFNPIDIRRQVFSIEKMIVNKWVTLVKRSEYVQGQKVNQPLDYFI